MSAVLETASQEYNVKGGASDIQTGNDANYFYVYYLFLKP